jgi:hypothetical protein
MLVTEFDKELSELMHFMMMNRDYLRDAFERNGIYKNVLSKHAIEIVMQFDIVGNDNRIIKLFLEDGRLLAWIKYIDFLYLHMTLLTNNCKNFEFGYIVGTHSPYGLHSGEMVNDNRRGYSMWIKTIK